MNHHPLSASTHARALQPNAQNTGLARLARSAALLALIAGAGLALSGCSKVNDVTGSIRGSTPARAAENVPADGPAQQRYIIEWAKRYERQPNDKQTVMNYARGLRAAHRHDQAIAVLQKAAVTRPKDHDLLAAYGKALADGRRFPEALQVLERAQVPERPDWTIYSAQGSIADQTGNHVLARQYYEEALKVAPGEPRILSNLGLSYALAKQLPNAERVLRQAVAHPRADYRVRQNLSLVLALQGKFAEAETIQQQGRTPADARANIAAIRQMIAQSNTWREIQMLDDPQAAPRNQRSRKPPKRTNAG